MPPTGKARLLHRVVLRLQTGMCSMPTARGSTSQASRWCLVDLKHRLEEPRRFARWTAGRLRQLVLLEGEVAALAARGNHSHTVSLRTRRSNRVTKVVFDLGAPCSEFAGERRNRPRFVREQIDEMPSEHTSLCPS